MQIRIQIQVSSTQLFLTKAVAWSDLVRYEIRFGMTPIKILQELALQTHLQ